MAFLQFELRHGDMCGTGHWDTEALGHGDTGGGGGSI